VTGGRDDGDGGDRDAASGGKSDGHVHVSSVRP
jgi:hypothetical protein